METEVHPITPGLCYKQWLEDRGHSRESEPPGVPARFSLWDARNDLGEMLRTASGRTWQFRPRFLVCAVTADDPCPVTTQRVDSLVSEQEARQRIDAIAARVVPSRTASTFSCRRACFRWGPSCIAKRASRDRQPQTFLPMSNRPRESSFQLSACQGSFRCASLLDS